MNRTPVRLGLVILGLSLAIGQPVRADSTETETTPIAEDADDTTTTNSADRYTVVDPEGIARRLAQYAPFHLHYDDSRLSDGEKKALEKLAAAGDYIDAIFLEQMLAGNERIFDALVEQYRAKPTDANRRVLEYYWFNKSPYDQANDDAPNSVFLRGPGIPEPMDPTRTFYPSGLTAEAFETWLRMLSPEERALANSDFTVIRSKEKKKATQLRAVPYSEAYAEHLAPLADELESIAALVPDSTLGKFLAARATAFRTNDYRESEGLWIGMNDIDDPGRGNIDVTIGPYENYLDELLKKKAAFQFYLTVLRPEATEALQLYKSHVLSMDAYLWELFQKYYGTEGVVRWLPPGDDVTLVAVDVAYACGMGNQGVQTLAFNLPNVAEWQAEFGTKKVMLMNVLDGKFEKILAPIADTLLAPKDRSAVVAEMFTDNTVRHEVAHGIGPSTIFVPLVDGASSDSAISVKDATGAELHAEKTTPRDRMQRYYSAFEEAKAEIVSLLFGYWLVENDIVKDPNYVRNMITTYVASTFRTIRFGATSDHARGKIFEFNRLTDYGAIEYEGGVFRINEERFRGAVEKLAMDILALQMFGDVDSAEYLLRADGHARTNVHEALRKVEAREIPIDLRVHYPIGRNYTVIR